jgi:hypothetical protein
MVLSMEGIACRPPDRKDPRALILHNPNAESPLPRDIWAGIPEFFLDGNRWRWSDEEPAAA